MFYVPSHSFISLHLNATVVKHHMYIVLLRVKQHPTVKLDNTSMALYLAEPLLSLYPFCVLYIWQNLILTGNFCSYQVPQWMK
jgi:hypothetical protein